MVRCAGILLVATFLSLDLLLASARAQAATGSPFWTAKINFSWTDTQDTVIDQPGETGKSHSSTTYTLNLLINFTAHTDASGNIHSDKIISVAGGGRGTISTHASVQQSGLGSGESSSFESGNLDTSTCRFGFSIFPARHTLSAVTEPMTYHMSGSMHSEWSGLPIPAPPVDKAVSEDTNFPDTGQDDLDLSGAFSPVGKQTSYSIKIQSTDHSADGRDTYVSSGTVVIVPGSAAVQISEVDLPDQDASMDSAGNLPFCANSSKTNNDKIHWTVVSVKGPGQTLHWSVSPDTGTVTPNTGTGNPPDFQIILDSAGSTYLLKARPAIHITLKAWLQDSAGNLSGAPATQVVTQSDLGRLRQEYADHPLKPVNTAMKNVPDVSSYVNTVTDRPDLKKFNHGDRDWAMVDPWMEQEYSAIGGLPLNSAYRNPVRNWKIYNDLNLPPNVSSQHMWGNAIDFTTSNTLLSYVSVAQQVVNTSANAVWEKRFDHVHVQHYISSPPTVARLFLLQNSINAGGSLSGIIILNHSNGSVSTNVTMQCSNLSALSMPATVTIPAGQLCGTVQIATSAALTARAVVTIVAATMTGYAQAKLTVTP